MNPIKSLSRHEAQEVLLLQRRLKYLSSKCEYGDDVYMYASHLKDVSSLKDLIEQLAEL